MLIPLALMAGISAALPQSPPPDTGLRTRAQDRVLRVLPIRDVLGTTRAPRPPRLGTLLRAQPSTTELLESWDGPRSLVSPNDFRNLVEQLLPEAARAASDVQILDRGGNLIVTGPPEVVERIVQVARSAAAALVRNVEVQAALYPLPERELPVVAGAAELADITKDLQPLWRARALTRAGNPVALANERLTPYLADVEVEVASRAQIGDPQIWTLFEGVRLVVQPHVLAGSDDVVLMCQAAVGERRSELHTLATGVDGLPTLDVPDLDVLFGAFSGRVPDGGALLVSCRSARELGGDFLLVVSARQRRAPVGAAEGVGYFPITALVSPSLRFEPRVVHPDSDAGSRALGVVFEPAPSSDVGLARGDMTNLLQDLVGAGERAGSLVDRIGGHVVVRDSPEFVRAAGAVIAELEKRSLRTIAVSVSSLREGEHGGEVLQRLDLPTLLGRSHAMVCGRETTAVADLDVEIAQRSSISNPVVRRVFAGLVVSSNVYGEAESRAMHAEVAAAAMGERQRRPTEGKGGGELWAPEVDHALYTYDGPLGDGVIDLGLGPAFEGAPTRQVLRVSALR